jgi:hypothetical protein
VETFFPSLFRQSSRAPKIGSTLNDIRPDIDLFVLCTLAIRYSLDCAFDTFLSLPEIVFRSLFIIKMVDRENTVHVDHRDEVTSWCFAGQKKKGFVGLDDAAESTLASLIYELEKGQLLIQAFRERPKVPIKNINTSSMAS